MRFKMLCFGIWLLVLSVPAYGAGGHRLNHESVLFVEPGDSYIGLFGPDWLRVFQANSNLAFYDQEGKLVHTPEKLVVGTRLVVPAGTLLSEQAMKRLNRYEKIKSAAFEAIREAEGFISRNRESQSEVYEQGLSLLGKAREAAKGLTFGFANYIEATKLAQEASRCFKINANLSRANHDLAQLKGRVDKESKRFVYFGLLIVPLLGLLCFMGYKQKKERVLRVERWLKHHQDRIDGLEKTIV